MIEAARKYRNWEIEAHALANKAMAHARLGEFAEAQDAIRLAHEAVRKTDSLVKEADVALCRRRPSSIWAMCGADWNIANGARRRLYRPTAWSVPSPAITVTGLGNLQSRNAAEAQQAFETALKLRSGPSLRIHRGSEQLVNRVHAGLAIARFFGGDDRGDQATWKNTLANADAVGDDYTVAFIAQALGEGYTQLGDFERAKQYLDTALDYYRRNDMRPYLARVLQSLAYLYRAQGQRRGSGTRPRRSPHD